MGYVHTGPAINHCLPGTYNEIIPTDVAYVQQPFVYLLQLWDDVTTQLDQNL